MVKFVGFHLAPLWHCSQRFFNGSAANCPLCSSAWQSVHKANLTLYFVSLPAGLWQSAHFTLACGVTSANLVLAWSAAVNVEGLQPFTVWQLSHPPLSGRFANCPLCSSLWQSVHVLNGILALKSPLLWHAMQETC